MAGSYPDAPSRRMAYDADGTVLVMIDSLDLHGDETSEAEKVELNDEDNVTPGITVPGNSQQFYAFIFPELREIDGAFGTTGNSATTRLTNVLTSGDSTNGVDGTFTNRDTDLQPAITSVFAHYRDEIVSYAVSNVRILKIERQNSQNAPALAIHIYGEISSGETPDRLLWFDQPSALEFALPIDYGDVPRGSVEDRVTFLKNNSGSLSASSVQISAEALFRGSGAWYTFDEGSGFSSTLSLASSISNGANSPNITIRRDIPDAEILGLHAGRSFVSVGSWA